MTPFYVYLAGPMSGYPSEYLANCAALSARSRELIDLELCPINPAGDLLEGIISAVPLAGAAYKRRSMELLRLLEGRPAAVLVLALRHRNGSVSSGVADELREAERLGIPVVYTVPDVLAVRAMTEVTT